jgi:hypothetical protein
MKLLVILMLTILCLSSDISARKIKGRRNAVLQGLYNFALGFFQSFSNGSAAACFGGWGSDALQNDLTADQGPITSFKTSWTLLSYVAKAVSTATLILCNFSALKEGMKKLLSFVEALLKKRRRMFLGGRRWGWSSFTNAVSHAASSAVSAVSNTASSAYNAVSHGVSTAVNAVGGVVHSVVHATAAAASDFTHKVQNTAAGIGNWASGLFPDMNKVKVEIANLVATLQSIFVKVKEVIMRLVSCGLMVAGLLTNIKNIYSAVVILTAAVSTSGASLVPFLPLMVRNLLCQWENIMLAFDYLVTTFTAVGTQRAFNFGKFIGKIAVVFGNVFVIGGLPATAIPAKRRHR